MSLCEIQKMHTVQDLLSKTRPQLLTEEVLSAMDQILREHDEATARRLRATLWKSFQALQKCHWQPLKGWSITLCILHYMLFMQRCRKKIGWVCT